MPPAGLLPIRHPLHVLVVSNHWGKSDNETHAAVWVDRQVSALRQLGVRVSTFDIGTSHSPWQLFHQWRELRDDVRRLRPDIVHARYGTLTATLSVWSGCRSIITFAGSDLLPGAGVSWIRTWGGITLSYLAALRANGLICVSQQLRNALWWCRSRVAVIPDGVDLTRFAPISREEARRALSWPLERPIIVMDAARDPINKGWDIALEALTEVHRFFPTAELKVFQGVKPDDMPLHYSAADVLLCASRQEGSPNVVKEALACNCPVVATPVGDVRERLAKVTPSFVVAREARSIADALIAVLRSGKRCNGRENVVHITLESMAQQVIEVYRRVKNS